MTDTFAPEQDEEAPFVPRNGKVPSDEVLKIIADDGTDQGTARRIVEHGDYDTTSLKPSQYANAVHRDWIGHWTRWGWSTRKLKKDMRVLEPGCGRETMLWNHVKITTSIIPSLYVGVDLDSIKYMRRREEKQNGAFPWAQFHEKFDFIERQDELADLYGEANFDRIISFEVYEHITPRQGINYLDACKRFLAPDGELLLSTPNFNGKKAANHIREYTREELQTILEDRGFEIVDQFGTFASYHDVKKGIRKMYPDEAEAVIGVYERCREFLGDDLLAGMLAPLVPEFSRNVTWICKHAQ